jgi:protein phosphatase
MTRLQFNLSSTVKESLDVQADDFIYTVKNVVELLQGEKGQIGNFRVSGKLVTLNPVGTALVIGDLHGDLESLQEILKNSKYISKMAQNKNTAIVFLGDYGDRGALSAAVYFTILKLKMAFPDRIILLRGNHEGPEDVMASPHNLPLQFQFKFKEKWTKAYSEIRELFDCMYNAIIVEERYLMVHGGLPTKLSNIEELARLYPRPPDFLEDLLWSDPDETIQGSVQSPRGAGKLFGKNVTETVLGNLGVRILIRGHETANEGYKICHKGKILTLFSRKGPPYYNEHGAYLNLPLSKKTENAQQLIPWIHKF